MRDEQPPFASEMIHNQRYLFLGMLSLVFCMSYFLTLFTPFPLALAILLYGRRKGFLMGVLGMVLMALLGHFVLHRGLIVYFYGLSFVAAGVISEIFYRKLHPWKGLFYGGALIYALSMAFVGGNAMMVEGGPTGLVTRQIEKAYTDLQKNQELYQELQQNQETREWLELLSRPSVWASELVRSFPFTFFMVLFFALWVNLFLVLKGYRIFYVESGYPYGERDLLDFKMPEWFIWPFIFTMLLFLASGQWGDEVISSVSKHLLLCFGLFYFFQGLGIFMELLRALKIGGFFGTLLIVLTVVTSYWLLALVGLFDLWVDFKALIRKKIDRR